MADYVILEGSVKNNRAQGFGYTAVPATDNDAGVAWRTALVEYLTLTREGGTAAQSPRLPGGIAQNQLNNGSILEWDFDVEFDANETGTNKLAAVEAAISARESEVTSELLNRLRFWGFEGVTS